MVLGIAACEREDEDVIDMGYDYYPLETGNYILYHVFEEIYDDFNDTNYTVEYQLLEEIDSSFTDLEGREVYKLNRYINALGDSVDIWNLKDVWTVFKGTSRLEKVEENQTYVKLSFPLRRGKTWDGNARNDSVSQDYTVIDYDLKSQLDSANFHRTCRVNQWERQNLIEDQLVEEIYARGVGLVERTERFYDIDPSDSSKAGYEIRWVYIQHGEL